MEPIEPKAPENDFNEIRKKVRQALFEDYNASSKTRVPEPDKIIKEIVDDSNADILD